MKIFLLVLEFLIACAVIIAILLHSPKTDGMGMMNSQARVFGGSNSMEAGLNRITLILAVLFMIIALLLATLF